MRRPPYLLRHSVSHIAHDCVPRGGVTDEEGKDGRAIPSNDILDCHYILGSKKEGRSGKASQ